MKNYFNSEFSKFFDDNNLMMRVKEFGIFWAKTIVLSFQRKKNHFECEQKTETQSF